MSAHLHMKHMLDQLMGTGRNGEEPAIPFTHQRVCKCFLLDVCPYDILSATRCDLGKCPKLHDFALRADYETAAKTKDCNFQPEVLTQLRNFITETERRTVVAKQRLVETQQNLTTNESIRTFRMEAIDQKIQQTLANLEQLGTEGNVEETMNHMKQLEVFKEEKATLEKLYRSFVPNSKGQQQQLRMCSICCSYLGFEDGDTRIADHFKGRMHLGFAKIRAKIDELDNYIQDKHIKQFLDREFQSSNHSQILTTPALQIGIIDVGKNPFSASGPSTKRSLQELDCFEDGNQTPKKAKAITILAPGATVLENKQSGIGKDKSVPETKTPC